MDEKVTSSVAVSICACDGLTTTGERLSVAAAASSSDIVCVKLVVLFSGARLTVEPAKFRLGMGRLRVTGDSAAERTGGL